MSWINDVKRTFIYSCEHCGAENAYNMKSVDHDREAIEQRGMCEICSSQSLVYQKFETEPLTVALRTKELYDKNGRQAYKIGNTYISKTKYDYLETGKIENQYTDSFKKKLLEDEVRNEQMLRSETNTRRARVTRATPRLSKNI